MTNTRFTLPCCIRKSDAHIALAVLPVPCSLKQKDFLCCVKNNAVLRWCLNGLYLPEKIYFCCVTCNVFSLLQQIKSAFFVVFLGYNHTRGFRFVAVRASQSLIFSSSCRFCSYFQMDSLKNSRLCFCHPCSTSSCD